MIGLWKASDWTGRWSCLLLMWFAVMDGYLAFRYWERKNDTLMAFDMILTVLMFALAVVNLHTGMVRRTRREIEAELARRANWWLN